MGFQRHQQVGFDELFRIWLVLYNAWVGSAVRTLVQSVMGFAVLGIR